MSKMEYFLNLSPLNTVVSRKVVLFSDISAVNLIVGWNLLAWKINCSTFFLSQSHSEKRHQCSVSILLAWFHIVRLFSFQFPP